MDNEESKMVVLTKDVGANPTAVLLDLLESLLKGLFGSSIELFIGFANSVLDLDVKVEELRVGLKTIPRPTRLILPNNATKPCVSNPKLDLILLSSNKTGRQRVFDICGSQFGLYEPFWKFEDYSDRYVDSIHFIHSMGPTKWVHSELAKLKGHMTVCLALEFEASISMHEEAKQWEIQHVPLTQLPTLPEDQSVETKASLLQALDLSVQNFFHANDYYGRLESGLAYQVEHPEQFQSEKKLFRMKYVQKVKQMEMQGYRCSGQTRNHLFLERVLITLLNPCVFS